MDDYKVENGYIVSPGKFEGLPRYAPYFWDLVLDGGADREEFEGLDEEDSDEYSDSPGRCYSFFDLKPEDYGRWHELSGTKTICLWEDDQGFVRLSVVS